MTAPMTTPEHTRNGRIALPLGMLLLTLCFLYLGISAWQERDRTWRAQQYGRAEAALRDLQQEQQSLRLQARIAELEAERVELARTYNEERARRQTLITGGALIGGGVLLGLVLPLLGRRRKRGYGEL